MTKHLIAANLKIGDPFGGIGPLGDTSSYSVNPVHPIGEFETIISVTIGVMTVAGGIWFIFQIFAGAFQWLSSGGEKQALQNAQKRIVNAVVGLLTIVLAYLFIAIIGRILGFNILTVATVVGPFTP